ncbi:hypothetical protein SAMN05444166_4762 [Singulisphaera sp. GP187]|uniref:hypothetical protein n=1 Tax=Singulisphaera sp. GP187 TaxID=1882752 RepID=UPI000927698E|nr:hypothetical protein [Singulisphaera sp. GP187]SIO44275.1 hypothetical protein SAMN05444166_4762 [Singulisphaera sp. GP187]
MTITTRPMTSSLREALAVVELFLDVFRRDLLSFYPQFQFEHLPNDPGVYDFRAGPDFQLIADPENGGESLDIVLFGTRHRLILRHNIRFTLHDQQMIRALGAVLTLRYHHLFQIAHTSRLELFRGGSEDHYVAAFIDPSAYAVTTARPSRIASTILTLRTAALSTYENRRVSTGALLLGPGNDRDHPLSPTSADALFYGVELTSLKSIHRLCDGKRTLFLVDQEGKLADIIDVERWAAATPGAGTNETPCARAYTAHARATRVSGHVCLVLSPNQEIKLFAGGLQAFVFAHGRWRILDPAAKFAVWEAATAHPQLARALFQTALDLAESRQGGLFVVATDPGAAVGHLIAPHDLLEPDSEVPCGPPPELTPGDPLAKRALHYLARGRNVTALAPSVLEALAGLDGAVVTDRNGGLIAFGAILRHDAAHLPSPITAEGARTTAAIVASRFGPVLKVSEDGLISCFLNGARVWDL